jgi:hypothetical protein
MRIMGLNDSVHWFTWFILCTVIMMLTALLLVIILKVNSSFTIKKKAPNWPSIALITIPMKCARQNSHE